ncbi:MAG: Rab family GTPase [Candidatus Hodarchaeota archaeon]
MAVAIESPTIIKEVKPTILKIIVCGEGGIGKTALINTFQSGRFMPDTTMTIAVQFHTARYTFTSSRTNGEVALQIWDLGGQRHFREMKMFEKYCRGAHAALVCFDLSDLDTLEEIPRWIELLPKNIPKILVGTKKDRCPESAEDIVEPYLEQLNFQEYFEISSKDEASSVIDVFNRLLIAYENFNYK